MECRRKRNREKGAAVIEESQQGYDDGHHDMMR